jgi:hypothetical protein
MHLPWVESLGRFLFVYSPPGRALVPLHAQKTCEKISWCIVHTRGTPGTPCLRVCQDVLSYTPGMLWCCLSYTLAWLSYALVAMGYYGTSYGKYPNRSAYLSYPFVYLGLFLAIALVLMHYAAHTLCTILHMPWLVLMVVTNCITYTDV